MITLTTRLTEPTYKAARQAAKDADLSLTRWLEEAIKEKLACE
jgi:predicted HicB family RNase H-like nuclease